MKIVISDQGYINIEKYRGALLGAVIGDALGWAQENRSMRIDFFKSSSEPKNIFKTWIRRSGGRVFSHEEVIQAGEYSDDSQLLLATARSLQFGKKWSKHFGIVELPAWLIYERGGGGATRRAADSWSKGIPPWKAYSHNFDTVKSYFNAGGNGVAMRILPHAFYCSDLNELTQQVMVNGIYTHGHPRALLGAILYSHAVFFLIHHKQVLEYGELIDHLINKKDVWSQFPKWQNNFDEWWTSADTITRGNYLTQWDNTVDELLEGLFIAKEGISLGALDTGNEILSRLNCFDAKMNGAGTVAALVSIYLASKYASDPATGLIEVSFLEKADTDTLASMVGGLLGTINGVDWIKREWQSVQDYEYIQKLANKSNFILKYEDVDIKLWSDRDNKTVKKLLKEIKIGDSIRFGSFNSLQAIQIIQNKAFVKNLDVITIKFTSEEGQTLYLKTFNKKSDYVTEKVTQNNPLTQMDRMTEGHLDSPILSIRNLEELSKLFSGRLSAKRAFLIVTSIIKRLKTEQFIGDREINKIAAEVVQTGIDLTQAITITKFISREIFPDKMNLS